MTPSDFDAIAWLSSVLDPEAYDDSAWQHVNLNKRGSALLSEMRAKRQFKAERKAIAVYSALLKSNFDIVSTAKNKPVVGYMCLIDWEHELGSAADGNKIYPSQAALLKEHSIAEDCGIVEVAVRLVRVVSEGTGK